MSFCILYNAVSEIHSVQNYCWEREVKGRSLSPLVPMKCRKNKHVVITAFFFRKKVYQLRIKVGPSSDCPSVCASVRPCGCASVSFLVNVSPPKRLDVATSNFVAE